MTYRKLFLFLIGTGATLAIANTANSTQTEDAVLKAGPSIVEIRQTGRRFELIRNGQLYFIKGAGGSKYMNQLVESGGNSIRTWSVSRGTLDQAQQKGLTVCMGLRMHMPRQGADYHDEKMLQEQRDRIRDVVMELKDQPALLMWGIGNEVEDGVDQEVRVLVWKEIETLAKMIKQMDKNHPVITVVAGSGSLESIKRYCPTLDAIGINSYGSLAEIPSQIRHQAWDKPYIITEFGPRGWWEVERTAWGLPIEDTSTEKALVYSKGYKAAIDKKSNCLGSYVFLWGNKQEKTHTWFNLFLEDGTPTEIVDTMSFLWTGQWPADRAPSIGKKKICADGRYKHKRHVFKTSANVTFRVQANDPDGDALTIKWDIRRDESDNANVGGDWERRIPPIEEAIVSSEANRVTIQMPVKSGNYRIFAYVYDPSGKVATVNLPVRVESVE